MITDRTPVMRKELDSEQKKKIDKQVKGFFALYLTALLFVVGSTYYVSTNQTKGGFGLSKILLTEYMLNKYRGVEHNILEDNIWPRATFNVNYKQDFFSNVIWINSEIEKKDTIITLIKDYYGSYDYNEFREYIRKTGFEKQYLDAFK